MIPPPPRSTWDRAASGPGGILLAPTALGALFVLVVNDHLLKPNVPNPLTGKLSDVAGLILLPLVIVAVLEIGGGRTLRTGATVGAAAAVALLFASWQIWPASAELYRGALGAAQRGVPLLGTGAPVAHTADLTDLLTLPAAWLAVLVARRRLRGAVPTSLRAT